MQVFGYEDSNSLKVFLTALLAITQLAALKITGKLADCQETFGTRVMPCTVSLLTER